MIPKIIHYCWFGRGKKSAKIEKYISSWHKHLPDYKFIEWNEDNFSIDYNDYVRKAYENKKYAFVSDVARLYALYKYGGIYLDTDIEVLKSLDCILENELIASWESNHLIMTGFMAAAPSNSIIGRFLDLYNTLPFISESGIIDTTPNTKRYTDLLVDEGLIINRKPQEKQGVFKIFPTNLIGAFDMDTMSFCNTEDTILIHHCMASWATTKTRMIYKIKHCVSLIFGADNYNRIKRIIKGKGHEI